MKPPFSTGIVMPMYLSAEERTVWADLLEHLIRVIWDESENGTDLRQAELYPKGRRGHFARKAG